MNENPIDRMDQISACLRLITDLLTPADDLHTVNREDFASAMLFLTTEYQTARNDHGAQRALDRRGGMRVV